MVFDSQGALYGTTNYGGSSDDGVVFKLAPPAAGHSAWTRSTLLVFSGENGANPQANLIFDQAGSLYGTTSAAGGRARSQGTIFRLIPPAAGQTVWTHATLFTFSGTDGANPEAPLIIDADGALYGTTYAGGSAGDGTVFKLAPPVDGKRVWTHTTLLSFSAADGANPEAGLVMDTEGALYGTTSAGGRGSGAQGTVFKLTPPAAGQTVWTHTTLFTFSGTDGANPEAGLVMDADGVLYGTTYSGGKNDDGTVFKLAPPTTGQTAWTHATLFTFSGVNGAGPEAALIMDADGALYGTTYSGGSSDDGTVFKLASPAAGQTVWTHTILYAFSDARGYCPTAAVIFDNQGALYGTASVGGKITASGGGQGTVFELPAVQ